MKARRYLEAIEEGIMNINITSQEEDISEESRQEVWRKMTMKTQLRLSRG